MRVVHSSLSEYPLSLSQYPPHAKSLIIVVLRGSLRGSEPYIPLIETYTPTESYYESWESSERNWGVLKINEGILF
jgi:hypothetical protein